MTTPKTTKPKRGRQHPAHAASLSRIAKGIKAAGRKIAKEYKMKLSETAHWEIAEVIEAEAKHLRGIVR